MKRTCTGLTLLRLTGMYVAHAAVYYRQVATGKPTREHLNIHAALRPLCQQFPELLASQLTCEHVLAYRQSLIAKGLTRSYVNAAVGRVRRMCVWAADSKIITQAQADGIKGISALPKRRSTAKENPRVQAVCPKVLKRTLALVPPAERELLALLCMTGARFSEVANLQRTDVHVLAGGSQMWLCPRQHKTAHHEVQRAIPVPAIARRMLQRRLAQATTWLFESSRFSGKPMGPTGIRNAIRRACKAAGVPTWTPHQIRHLVARTVRAKAGLDATSALLGHTSTRMTEHYAPVPAAAAMQGSRAAGLAMSRLVHH